jgi:tRNA dimethylallyltransferase
MADKKKLIIIIGPTGVGKTSSSLSLAKELPVEFINADSMQVYRYMDIGTAKPEPEELSAAPHHLVSIVDPDEDFDAAKFMELGRKAVDDICLRGNIPVVVGGTALYIRALISGIFDAPGKDENLRKKLMEEEIGNLHKRLSEIDPETAVRVNQNDRARIVRALEVYYLTGERLTVHHNKHKFEDAPYDCLRLCLNRDREVLYGLIEKRVDKMMKQGFLCETKDLLEKGYSPQLKSMQSIGYKQLVSHLTGHLSLEEAVLQIKRETRRFAKRQLTWFRKEPDIVWIELPEKSCVIIDNIKKFLSINR